jgi:HSP20 family protein
VSDAKDIMMTEKQPEKKFDPVREFVNIRDSLGRAVEQGIRRVAGTPPRLTFPAVDVYETEDAVFVRTEPLLGADAGSIEVSMENDMLTISGATMDDPTLSAASFLSRELIFGTFSRAVRIPRKVKSGEAKASFRQGILTVRLPKVEDSSAQIIKITPAD